MRRILSFSIILITMISCEKVEQSKIEVIKINMDDVKKIVEESDTSYIDPSHNSGLLTIYINRITGDSCEILKDSLGNIIFKGQRRNGKCISTQEYYPNGQLKGKFDCSIVSDSGDQTAIYYYADGRIRSEGKWRGLKMIDVWKNYDEKGLLTLTEYYDLEGKLVKEVKSKR